MNISTSRLSQMAMLNLATLVICTSAIIARYMNIDPKLAIFGRAATALPALYLIILIRKEKLHFHKKDLKILVLTGVLFCFHWLLYFWALALTNVAIGVITIFTYPIWTVLLEPFILKTKFDKINLLLALALMFGIFILVPPKPSDQLFLGIAAGVGSAVVYAIRNILSKSLITRYSGFQLTFFQVVVVVLALVFFIKPAEYQVLWDHKWMLLLLGAFTSAIGHGLMVHSLNYFNPGEAGIMASLQPVYSIILGAIILHETPDGNALMGGAIIIGVVVFEMVKKLRARG